MNFCIISPTAGLERYATRSKTHMVLAHQCIKDERYREFYLERRSLGEHLILDNGAYEGAYDESIFLKALDLLIPDVAVLPDAICKGIESTKKSLDFLRVYSKVYQHITWMWIPQGETLTHWRASFNCYPHFDEIEDVWIGLTRFLPTHTCPSNPLIRVELAAEIRKKYPHLTIHCMGMADGDLKELRLLAMQKIVRSIDSSAPVWRGWLGLDIRDRITWRSQGNKDVNFSATHRMDYGIPGYDELINRNLEVVLEHCNV